MLFNAIKINEAIINSECFLRKNGLTIALMLSLLSIMTKRNPEKLFPTDYLLRPFLFLVPRAVSPNHITVFRIALTPFVLAFLFLEMWYIGVPLFVVAVFTDWLDGVLARSRKQVTKWGVFHDPIADKILIGSVVVLIVLQHVNPIIAVAIIIVEVLLIIGGWYRRRKNIAQTANVWGKIKMVLQFIGVLLLLIALAFGVDLFIDISQGTLVLAVIFAIVSLLTYSL